MGETWFDFRDIRKRRLGDAVWVPLWVAEYIQEAGEFGYVGYAKEYYGLGSVAIPLSRRDEAGELSWHDVAGRTQGVWATKDYYKPAEVFQRNDREDLGIDLVMTQRFPAEDATEVHLNQDIVFALGLKREGDVWLKPDEGYAEVVRLRRGPNREPVALEMKNSFLRDYLCAREMFLWTSLYRQRAVIVEDAAHVGSPNAVAEATDLERFELRLSPMVEGGHFGDATFAVMHVGRTDVDPDEDVPVPGPETDANTKSESWQGRHEGRKLMYISGDLWRQEEIAPAEASTRVRGDDIPTGLQFVVDAAGNRASSEELNNEDQSRWLWFRPEVIPDITSRRSGGLTWYTMETGGVELAGHGLTHFGINRSGLVNVYAYDIARLPTWQQQIWAGHNVGPDGGVSAELLASQMKAEPANTNAPEEVLPRILADLNLSFRRLTGAPLFRQHAETNALIGRINRFRALTPGGLLALAKDLMRLVADQIDASALQKIVPPPKGANWGSLKSLENVLATLVPAERARSLVGPLVGAYELRLADAHMPKGELGEAYKLARTDPDALPLKQGFQLIASVTQALIDMWRVLEEQGEKGRS